MRIDRLDLTAYGRFTGVSLDLSGGDRGLHIIQGPNEAGKTTSLRALEGWLFDFPHQLDDNFVHRNELIRVGGALRDEDGSTFESVRRKTRLRSLRGADDEADADENVLKNRLLGGVDRRTFVQRFTLNHKSLSEGGKAALEAGGEFATILFGSGLDLDELRRYRKALREEIDGLFKPTGEKPSINKRLKEIAEQEKAISAAALRGSDWTEGIGLRDQLLRRRREMENDLKRVSAERDRLERIRLALPDVPNRDRLERELAALADTPRVPVDFGTRLHDIQKQRSDAETAHANAAKTAARHCADLAGLPPQATILDDGVAIRLTQSQISGQEQTEANREKRRKDLKREKDIARRYLIELGSEENPESAEPPNLPDDLKATLVTHRKQWRVIETEFTKKEGAVNAAQARVAALRTKLDRPPPPSPAALRRAIERALALGDSTEARDQVADNLRRLQSEADTLRGRIGRADEPEVISRLPVPSPEVLEEYRVAMAAAVAAATAARELYDADEDRLQDLKERMARIDPESKVPEEADLTIARALRDAAWHAVKIGGRAHEATDLAGALEAAIYRSDDIADRLRSSATEVAAKSANRAEKTHLEEVLQSRGRRKTEAVEAIEKLELRGTQLWSAVGAVPGSPLEMIEWQFAHAQLMTKFLEIRAAQVDLDRRDEERSRAVADLHRELKALGEPVVAGEPLAASRKHAEAVLSVLLAAWAAHDKDRLDLEPAEEEQTKATADLADVQKRLDAWRAHWDREVQPLGLSGDTPPDRAVDVLQTLSDLAKAMAKAAEIETEIHDGLAASESFAQRVAELAGRHDPNPDSGASTPETIFGRIVKRLEAAEAVETMRNASLKSLNDAESEERNAESRLQEARIIMAALAKEAGAGPDADLADIERRNSKRSELERDLKATDEHLANIAPGKSPDEVVSEARETPADGLAAGKERLDDQVGAALAELREIDEQIVTQKSRLDGMEQAALEARAEAATREREHVMGLLETDVERYVHLRLAQAVLNGAIADFREQNEAPVLRRAGEHFARLTLGSFCGLGADADDKGDPFLVGVRPDGTTRVGVGGMSTGTVDQLYLAMKLASLEHYIQTRPPLPLVVDDLLIQFDDERAAAALLCLAELSRKTQILFFTHHDHLVELARSRLPAETLFIHWLGRRSG